MTREDKDLLIKDLCARVPCGVRFRYKYIDNFFHETYGTSTLTSVHPPYRIEHDTLTGNEYLRIEEDEIKPYLFPMSNMTEEQKTSHNFLKHSAYANPIKLIDFYNKHHFDYRGLIEKGLAIDATGLNVY